jgi:hypothetical protein
VYGTTLRSLASKLMALVLKHDTVLRKLDLHVSNSYGHCYSQNKSTQCTGAPSNSQQEARQAAHRSIAQHMVDA